MPYTFDHISLSAKAQESYLFIGQVMSHMCSSHIIWSYHNKVQVILSANPIGNGRSPRPLQFPWFPICQKNLWSSEMNPEWKNHVCVRLSWLAHRNKFWCCLQSWNSGLPLIENGWSLLGAEIFPFEICLENRTNFEDKNLVFTCFIYLMILISARSWALCAWIRGDLFEKSFWRVIFRAIFLGSYLGVIFGVILGG